MRPQTQQEQKQQRFETFGEYLRALRKSHGWTQEEVERRSGKALAQEYQSLLEQGRRKSPSPQICKVIARIYKIPFKQIWLAVQSEMLGEPIFADIQSPNEIDDELASILRQISAKDRAALLEQAHSLHQSKREK